MAETRIRLETVDPAAISSEELRAEGVEVMVLDGGIVHLVSGSDAPAAARALQELVN